MEIQLTIAEERIIEAQRIGGSCFLNLGSEVQVLSGTPLSAQLSIYRHARQ
jgi:hypothetical protein